jgi:DNA-binding GntR family transcriptional regulator
MPDASAPRSLSAAVFAEMRADILAGKYAPGSKLSPRVLATHHKVSLSVVREALTRLAEQGLVVAEPQLGFSVVGLEIDDVRDALRVRILIEGAAIRDAVEHSDVEYETAVVAAHYRLSRTTMFQDEARRENTEEWSAAHAVFHSTLISASTSPRLRALASGLRDATELYRRWSGPFSATLPVRDVAAEHQALVDAVLAHDADRAVVLITEHINLTAEQLAAFVAAQHDDTPVRAVGDVE